MSILPYTLEGAGVDAEPGTADPGWQPPVFILSGAQGAGKTTFLLEVLKGLAGRSVQCRGIVAPGYYRNNLRAGFSITDLSTGASGPLSSDTPFPGCERHGRFYFHKEGLALGCRALACPRPEETDLLIIDEVGRFELKGEVWAGCIDSIVAAPYPPMIWSVRSDKVDEVMQRWPVTRPVIRELGRASADEVIRDLMEEIGIYRLRVRNNPRF